MSTIAIPRVEARSALGLGAATDDGPMLLEANTNLDVMFSQRACRKGFGRSPLGPVLATQLAELARARGL